MSGHSKWSTIKRAKGIADIKRSGTFTKLANAITIATKLGASGDIDSNPRLRMAVDAARAVNMPKENIQRAIDRGLGKLGGHTLEEMVYEGYGPARVAFIVEAVTDNKNRTLAEIKNLFDRSGGNLGSSGSTSFMFDRKGETRVESKGGSSEDEQLELIDLGAEDVEEMEAEGKREYLVYTDVSELNTMGNKITQSGYRVVEAGIVFRPNVITQINNSEDAQKVLDFSEKLEDMDDVQKVFSNFDIPEELIS